MPDCRQPGNHSLPVRARPIDMEAAGALREVIVVLRDILRYERTCLAGRDGHHQDVALRAAKRSFFARIEAEIQVMPELAQLIVDGVVRDQGMATTKDFAPREIAIASQEPSALALGPFYQKIIRKGLVVGSVISQDAKPTSQPAQHGIGKKGPGGGRLFCCHRRQAIVFAVSEVWN